MNLIRKGLIGLFFLSSCFPILAQETNCTDTKDNDDDGLVDCFDPDCNGVGYCDSISFFGGDSSECRYIPDPIGFGAQEDWITDLAHTVSPFATPVAGDIDGDQIPEVIAQGTDPVTPSAAFRQFHVFNGRTGAYELSLDMELALGGPSARVCRVHAATVALGNLDADPEGEVVVVSEERHLIAFNHDGTALWNTAAGAVGLSPIEGWCIPTPAMADFDQDCIPEVYAGYTIVNGATGAVICTRSPGDAIGQPGSEKTSLSIAADILPASGVCPECDGLELVCGNTVYWVNIGAGTMGVATEILTAGYNDGFTSVADYDMDGDLDVIVSSTFNPAAGTGRIYVWDGATPTIIAQDDVNGNGFPGGGGSGAIGPPTLADFDNDGLPEIGLAGFNLYVLFDDHTTVVAGILSKSWEIVATDPSATTGSSVFDFNGDASNEVVFRATDQLYVYDGVTGGIMQSITCNSGTVTEHPIILDVDGEDQTEIVCACDLSDEFGYSIPNTRRARIHSFRSANVPWIPSRKIWNQHSYFNVNINDDMTIPGVQQNHALWPELNAFLTQATYLDENGNPIYPAPDAVMASIDADLTDIGDVTDSPDSICIGMEITNISGDLALETGIPVALYLENPWSSPASVLGTTVTPQRLDSLDTVRVSVCFECMGDRYTVYGIVNDDALTGTTPFTGGQPNIFVGECDYTNNTGVLAFDGCVFPLEDIHLSGTHKEGKVQLVWNVLNEMDVSHYTLYKQSEEGTEFRKIHKKWAQGAQHSVLTYDHADMLVSGENGPLFYKVRGYDHNGAFVESNVVEINLEAEEDFGILNLFPNPAKNSVTVDLMSFPGTGYRIEVWDQVGRLGMEHSNSLEDEVFREQVRLNLDQFSPGVYYIRLLSKGRISSKKLIIR